MQNHMPAIVPVSTSTSALYSAGHHLLPICVALGEQEAAAQILTDTTDLHEDHGRDAGDTIMTAFQAGTYTKVTTPTWACKGQGSLCLGLAAF